MQIDLGWTKEEKEILTKIQIEICEMRANGFSLEAVMQKHGVAKQAIFSCICATLKGNKWNPHTEKGGGDSYLGDVDVKRFSTKIFEFSADLNCLKTIEAVQLCYELRTERYCRANFISCVVEQYDSVRIRKAIISLEPYIPCESWLTKFCSLKGIHLKSPETLEEARRRYCTTSSINGFFFEAWEPSEKLLPRKYLECR